MPRTFIFNGFQFTSELQAESAWWTIGLILDRIVNEHMEQYKAVRMLKLMTELRDTIRLYYHDNITVSISLNEPESFDEQNDITMGYFIPSPLPK
jgi:hypothetical protein